MTPGPADVTHLLVEASRGDRGAVDALLPHVYKELRHWRMAKAWLHGELTRASTS